MNLNYSLNRAEGSFRTFLVKGYETWSNANLSLETGFLFYFCVPAGTYFITQVMLTTRNIFIANLAVSDILLCAFTMPLTMVDLITKYWTLGPDQVQSIEIRTLNRETCISCRPGHWALGPDRVHYNEIRTINREGTGGHKLSSRLWGTRPRSAKIINIQRCFKRCRRYFHANIEEYSGALIEEKAGKEPVFLGALVYFVYLI
jgi:hypothetical protein